MSQDLCRFLPSYSALGRPLVNLMLYGPSQRFVALEGLTWQGAIYACICLVVGVYLALPLLGAIGGQLVALRVEWALAIRARLATLRA
jgi:hypothetical protein